MSIGISAELFEPRIDKVLPVFDETSQTLGVSDKGLENIVQSAQSCAPYLAMLIDKWPMVITDLRTKSPEQLFVGLLETIEGESLDDVRTCLRQTKQKVHLLAALCDLAGVWNWSKVCKCLSDFADRAMQVLIAAIAHDMSFEGTPDNPVPGMFVLALGKYGACELNYSSDIDLIVFYDPERIKLPNPARAQRALVRFVQKLMRGFDDITEQGYVFRTDLRLRPDPRATTVAVSTRTAERYYESLGQNWERAAMIKARTVGGDRAAADDFFRNVLTPFIWRRSMDFHAIDDVHSIKRQIQGGAKPQDIGTAGHNIKLGVGGIREIEFFVQVQQLILGGRNPQLRTPRTVEALQVLADGGFTELETARVLQEKYALFRDIEHRVQMYADAQTHIWPTDSIQRGKLTALCGMGTVDELEVRLQQSFQCVHAIYRDLFAGEEDLSTAQGVLVFTGVEPEAITLKTFENYGFNRGPEIWNIMSDWLGGRIAATRTERARELLTRLAPRIIEACGATGVPDTAFFSFAAFATQLKAGVTLFSLFVSQPAALISLIEMLAMAPKLAAQLAARPNLIDALTDPGFLNTPMNISQDRYARLLDPALDFETSMNVVRRAVHEDHFMFTARYLRGHNPRQAGQILSDIAQAAIFTLLPCAKQEVERIYGPVIGEYAVLGLGKLGGKELSLKSDLDIMLIYEDGETNSARDIFNKFTRRIITALSSVTAEGGLYDVDMALRPSGRAGPLAVSSSAFLKYYREDAWTWEFMALCRARIVASSSHEFEARLSKMTADILSNKDFMGNLSHDVLDMQQRLRTEKSCFGLWDMKNISGGLRDIEFIAQFLILKHKPESVPHGTVDMLVLARDNGWLPVEKASTLIEAAVLMLRLQQALAITVSGNFDPSDTPIAVKSLLARITLEKTFDALENTYRLTCQHVEKIFKETVNDQTAT